VGAWTTTSSCARRAPTPPPSPRSTAATRGRWRASCSPAPATRAARGARVVVVVGADARKPAGILATAVLHGPGGANGVATLSRDGGNWLNLQMWSLPASPRARPYGVWLGTRFLGYAPPVRSGRGLDIRNELPAGADALGARVLVTRERASRPRRPGPALASGVLR
jgi:hypothetical protein